MALTSPPTQDIAAGRGASEVSVDKFNQWMRSQPWHAALMQGRSSGLSRQEQAKVEAYMAQNGVTLPPGMHVDQGGNLNQRNRLGRNAIIVAGVAGAAFGGAAALGAFSGAGAAGGGVAATGVGGMSATSLGLGTTAGLGTAGLAGTAATAAVGGGVGVGSKLAGLATSKGLETLGRAAGGYEANAAHNRGTAMSAMMDQDRMRLAARQQTMNEESDGLRKSVVAQYVGSGGYQPTSGADPRYTTGIAGPMGSSPEQMAYAQEMQRMLAERQKNPYQPTDISPYTKPGQGERWAGLLSLGTGLYGAYRG